MAYQARPNSGTFRRSTTKKSPNSPDYWGDITVDASVIQYLMQAYKANLEPKLKLSGWNKQNKRDGSHFISLSVEVPQDVRQQPPQRQQPQPAQQGLYAGNGGYGQQMDAFAPQASNGWPQGQQSGGYVAPQPQAGRGYPAQGSRPQQPEPQVDPFNDEIPW